ncbi:hypothetical protein SHKM778_72590 [Streptomyces sp. KM77-8]|uniref:Uncharacterized protein n=1 Tax=Streptomyces haneummycinicus TaxID=3074435 RepID=A0AAT9HTL9_9ACTN
MAEYAQGDPAGAALPRPVHGGPYQRPAHAPSACLLDDGEAADLPYVRVGGEFGGEAEADVAHDPAPVLGDMVVTGPGAFAEEGVERRSRRRGDGVQGDQVVWSRRASSPRRRGGRRV